MTETGGADRVRLPMVRPETSAAGGFFARLLRPLFAKVTVETNTAERLRNAYAEGVVVHVLRARRVIDPLFILSVLERLGLPRPRWMHDHYAGDEVPSVESMLGAVRAGEPILLFLRRPKTLTSPTGSYSEKHVEALLNLQRHLDRPILLVPESLIWTRKAAGVRRTIFDVIFGDREAPGRMRELVGFFVNRTHARFHVGAPFDVKAFLQRESGNTHKSISRKIRWVILNHLAREEAIRAGPIVRPTSRTRQLVMKDPSVLNHIRARGEAGEDEDGLRSTADQILKRMAADVRFGWIRVLSAALDRVWKDIYDGHVVDDAGLNEVWNAARRGPIVLVPSHKSHIDYLVLSQVFYKDGLMPPHIAAGDNLTMPILGTIFRRTGAFFIRRSFKGDRLYQLLVAAYVKRLLKDGHALEFFIEGGRSRTGKQLAPKLGMLSMCVDPVFDQAVTDVSFVPVSISYEKIIEATTYANELGGGGKKKEDLGTLVSARRVLRSRYGRVYVDFDQPISMRAFAASRGVDVTPVQTDDARRALVEQLAHRIANGIGAVTRVTPTGIASVVLLATTRRGMTERDLGRRAERMIELLGAIGARMSSALQKDTRQDALREALGRLAGDGLLGMTPAADGETIYQLTDSGRRALDYYKNNALHYLVPHALVCLALLAQPHRPALADDIEKTATDLSTLLEHEFAMRIGAGASFSRVAELLESRRVLERDDADRWTMTLNGQQEALELAGLIAVFFEAYRLVASGLTLLESGSMPQADLTKKLIVRADKDVLVGRIRRPEAVSKLTMDNAFALFTDLGFVVRGEDGRLSLVEGHEDARAALIDKLDRVLLAVA